jgi:hypothetical protein
VSLNLRLESNEEEIKKWLASRAGGTSWGRSLLIANQRLVSKSVQTNRFKVGELNKASWSTNGLPRGGRQTVSWMGPPQGERAPRVGPTCTVFLAREWTIADWKQCHGSHDWVLTDCWLIDVPSIAGCRDCHGINQSSTFCQLASNWSMTDLWLINEAAGRPFVFQLSFFFIITLGLELSDTKVHEP